MKLFLSLLLLILPLQAFAEIYVVDIQKVLNDSDAGKKAKSTLEGKFKNSKDSLASKKKNLAKMQEDVKAQSSLLSEEALQKKISAIRSEEKEVLQTMQNYQDQFMKENATKITKIMENVSEILEDMKKEKGYSLVLEKNDRIVLYAEDTFDLTDDVIDELNDRKITF